MQEDDRHQVDPTQERPTTTQPLHGPRKSLVKPLFVTLAVIAAILLIYFVGLRFLVPSG